MVNFQSECDSSSVSASLTLPYCMHSCLLNFMNSSQPFLVSHYVVCSWFGPGFSCFNQYICVFQGPLFQQRPYPSPGAVLRKNAEIATLSKKGGSHFTPISKKGDGSDGLGDADWDFDFIGITLIFGSTVLR